MIHVLKGLHRPVAQGEVSIDFITNCGHLVTAPRFNRQGKPYAYRPGQDLYEEGNGAEDISTKCPRCFPGQARGARGAEMFDSGVATIEDATLAGQVVRSEDVNPYTQGAQEVNAEDGAVLHTEEVTDYTVLDERVEG